MQLRNFTVILIAAIFISSIFLPAYSQRGLSSSSPSYDAQKQSLVDKLIELKSRSGQLKQALEELDDELDILDKSIRKNQVGITETEYELSRKKEMLNGRAAAVYKEGAGLGTVQLFLGAQSVYDLVTRIDFFNILVESDIEVVKDVRKKKIKLIKLNEKYLIERQKIVLLKDQKERSFSEYVKLKEDLKKKLYLANTAEVKQVEKWMVHVKTIENFLAGRKSPMTSSSSHFVLAGKKYGVNPKLIVAISGIESSFGINNCARFNAWGRKAKGGGYKSYASWKEAIWDQAYYLKTSYLDKGLVTVDQIAPKYCPPKKVFWAEKVKHFMALIK